MRLTRNQSQALSWALVLAFGLLGWSPAFPNPTGSDRKPQRMTWSVDGIERHALVFLPAEIYEESTPVVFGFHGHGGKARNAARKFRIQELWPEAIVVYMAGLPTPGRLTDPEGKKSGWQHAVGEQDDRDLKFFDAVLKTLREDHGIDDRRIYATGHSNGGGFTYLLWTSRPKLFAAIAPSAAGSGSLRSGEPSPVPVMHLAGKNDQTVKYEWQKWTMRRVCEINECSEAGEPWADVCTLFSSPFETPFVACVHNGNHKYPQIAPELIVRFFRENQRPA